jgi:hypothetical protein
VKKENMADALPDPIDTETRAIPTVPVTDTHTPGPWQLNTADGRVPAIRCIHMPHGEADTYRASIQTLARVHVCELDFGYGQSVDLANARLIAAAPALLEALKAIVRGYDGPTVDAATAVSSHIQAARMAIGKAEGR